MSKRFVVGLMGANRPGILAAVATALGELGGDIHEARQTCLQKHFMMLLAVDFPDHRGQAVIENHIRGVCGPFGAEVTLRDPEQDPLPDDPDSDAGRYFLTLSGANSPGVFNRVCGRLAGEGIDIADLYGMRQDPTNSFSITLELIIPRSVDLVELQQEINLLGSSIGLSAQFQPEHEIPKPVQPSPVNPKT